MGNSLFWNTVGSERMNGSARAIDINNVYMHVGVITYSITLFSVSMHIYHFVTGGVIILPSIDMLRRAVWSCMQCVCLVCQVIHYNVVSSLINIALAAGVKMAVMYP